MQAPRYAFGPRLLEPGKAAAQRERVLPILSAALEAVDPYTAVRRALRREGQRLWIGQREYDLGAIERLFLVGAGKAGAPMARAVEDLLGDRLAPERTALNVKRGHAEPTRLVRLQEGGHPIPDQAGLEGTARIVDLAQQAGEHDLLLCLI
jgi:hydroxypyruvate reductase